MILEINSTNNFSFNDLHDCIVTNAFIKNDILTLLIDGQHDSVKCFDKEEIIVDFYLTKDFSDIDASISLISTSIWQKTSFLTLNGFIQLCTNKKYDFEIMNMYCNGKNFCIIGFLTNQNHRERKRKVVWELSVDKVIYR